MGEGADMGSYPFVIVANPSNCGRHGQDVRSWDDYNQRGNVMTTIALIQKVTIFFVTHKHLECCPWHFPCPN